MQSMPAEAMKELREKLGEANVSDDPGLRQVYSYMNSLGSAAVLVWMPEPLCVVLPGSVEDIQAVLSVCSKYGLKFKAHSTAWINFALASTYDTILIDMRRMDNIVEFNAKDGYAVVESYVPGGVLQAQTMKEGFSCHLCGAGPNASVLASATSMQGSGGTSQSMSNSDRNSLGVEWVTSSGDLLHLGSPGTPEAGWMCGDGPGPSLRGMMRGSMANGSSNGVFTRVGLKCYPWYPPEQFKCDGSPPFFETEDIPFTDVRIVEWYNGEDECEGMYRISEAELTDYCARVGPGVFESALSNTNEEYESIVDSGIFRNTLPRACWTFSIIGNSQRALDYRMQTLEKIADETGGVCVDPRDFGSDAYEVTIQTAVRATHIIKACFMPTSGAMCFPPMSYETIDQLFKPALDICLDVKEEAIQKDQIEDDYADNVYASLDEQGHFGHNEAPYKIDIWEPLGDPLSIVVKGLERGQRANLQVAYMGTPATIDAFYQYLDYLLKIQELVDPQELASSIRLGLFRSIRPLAAVQNMQ